MTLTGVVVQYFQRRWNYGPKAVASGWTRCREAHTSCMLWDPVGPVRIAPLLAPDRAVLARPCRPHAPRLRPFARHLYG